MFHPERLTGKRRRKYFQSITYAPAVESIPKHLRKVIKAPPHHVKYVLYKMPNQLGVRSAHYVAVIRNRIALLNHPKENQAGERAVAELSGTKNWRCDCYGIGEMYGTLTKMNGVYNPRQRRKLAHASNKADLPAEMIELRQKCRRPRCASYRTTYVDPGKGQKGYFETANGDTALAPHVPPAYLNQKFLAAGLPAKIGRRAAAVLQAALRVRSTPADRDTTGDITVSLHRPPLDETCHLAVKFAARGLQWLVEIDTYTWYARLYTEGLAVLGDWFLTDATVTPGRERQQPTVVQACRVTEEVPRSCQYAEAVNLTLLGRERAANENSHNPPQAVGVIVRPFPGGDFFYPVPNLGVDDISSNRQSAAYTLSANRALTKPYTMAEARKAAADYRDGIASKQENEEDEYV